MKARTCEICGARVTNLNPRVTTCGPVCTEAKRSGRTLKHQMRKMAEKPYAPTENEVIFKQGIGRKPETDELSDP